MENVLYHSKDIVVLSFNLKKDISPVIIFECDQSYGGLKVVNFANLGQLARDIIRAINA